VIRLRKTVHAFEKWMNRFSLSVHVFGVGIDGFGDGMAALEGS
jgi:hypothetical protein